MGWRRKKGEHIGDREEEDLLWEETEMGYRQEQLKVGSGQSISVKETELVELSIGAGEEEMGLCEKKKMEMVRKDVSRVQPKMASDLNRSEEEAVWSRFMVTDGREGGGNTEVSNSETTRGHNKTNVFSAQVRCHFNSNPISSLIPANYSSTDPTTANFGFHQMGQQRDETA
ncbi:hypothetical protein MKX01_026896 [Papaver californicum]|nr:hypothetical protein MKX01_026896 [Papaver californicum]